MLLSNATTLESTLNQTAIPAETAPEKNSLFNGYYLYILSASDSNYDLPLYPKLFRGMTQLI